MRTPNSTPKTGVLFPNSSVGDEAGGNCVKVFPPNSALCSSHRIGNPFISRRSDRLLGSLPSTINSTRPGAYPNRPQAALKTYQNVL